MATPAQSWSILFSAFLSPLGAGVPQGYAATKSSDGKSYVVASTANLALSTSGTVDGIQLSPFGNPGDTVQLQRDAKVDMAVCPWLGNGIEEDAVVDANGKVQRASVATGIVIGRVDKEGGVALRLGGATSSTPLAGDVNGPGNNNKVWSISGNGGAVSVLGGAWSIAAAVALTVTQVAASGNAAVNDISYETQSASATATTNVTGGNFGVTLGSNKDALVTPWLNPAVPAFNVNYRDRTAGVVNIASISPTRFFGAAGIGAGMYLNGANSWLDIGANPPQAIGVIGVDNGTDAIATRNFANSADMAVLGTDTSDRVVIARTGTAGVLVAPLAGAGTRMVTADASGVLSTQAIPSGTTYGNDLDAASVAGNQIVDSLTGSAGIVLVRGTAALQFGSTNPAASGLVRAPNNVVIVAARNAAHIGDVPVLQIDASDQAYLGTLIGGFVAAPAAGNAYVYAGGAARISVTGSTGMVTLSNGLTVGSLTSGATSIVTASTAGVLGITATVPVGNGGTGLSSPGASGNVLTSNGTTWVSSPPSGGGTPGGSTTQMQYNNAGAFGGTAEFTYASSKLGVSSAGAITFGTTPATTAYLRFANASTIVAVWGGAANYVVLDTDASNNVWLGGTSAHGSQATNVHVQASSTVNLDVASTTYLSISSTTATFSSATVALGTGVVTQGSSVSGAGSFRVNNTWSLTGRTTGGATQGMLQIDSSNQVILADTLGGVVARPAAGAVDVYAGGSLRLRADGSTGFVAVIDNLFVGASSATMNSATHTIYLNDGTQPTAAPTTGVYLGSDSGSFHFRSSFSSAGVPVNIKFVEVSGGMSGTLDPDHAIKIIIDKPGAAAQTRWIRTYT